MTEHEHDRDRQPSEPVADPQVPPQDPQPETPPQPETASVIVPVTRAPDGTWTLHLTGSPEDQRREMRGIVRAVAAALRTDGNGGESCPEQIGDTVSQWATEAIYA